MSTMGLVKFGSLPSGELGLKRPAAFAESDFESTHVSNTGMTPSTRVFSSRIYLTSSSAISFITSVIVAESIFVLVVRTLLADRILAARPGCLESGKDKTDIRSECVVSLLLNSGFGRLGLFLLLRDRFDAVVAESSVSCVIVVCEISDAVSVAEDALIDAMEAIVESLWLPPPTGGGPLENSGRGHDRDCSSIGPAKGGDCNRG